MTRFLCCVALWWLMALPGAGAQEAARAVKAVQVSERAWYVEGVSALGSGANRNFISNAGFVVTPAGVVVVDALGSPALARELIEQIRAITPLPITDLVLTHYHADHIYGLQVFKEQGTRIWAHRGGLAYLHSDTARLRLQASREELSPWIDAQTRLVEADEWLDGPRQLVRGGVTLQIQPVGPSHTPEDLVVFLPGERVLFAGDLVFRGRIPFVGQANSRQWIASLERLLAFDAQTVVPGHGPASVSARADMELTRDYLVYLRQTMGRAARELEPFESAYQATDWSRFDHLPLFRAANRMNAYNTYLLMETEGVKD